jgi:hypothetical protein
MNINDQMRDFFLAKFSQEPQKVLPILCTLSLPRTLFLSKYKILTPIEAFREDEKKQWKAFVHELFPDQSKEFKLDAVKIIYTIGVLTN